MSITTSSSLSFVDIFVIIILLLVLVLYLRKQYNEVEYVKSNYDGRTYLVRKLPDRQQASDLLARVNERLQLLVNHLVAKYGTDDNGSLGKSLQTLYQKYNPDAISEGGNEHGYTSYSINKGEKIVLCIRQKNTNAFVDINVIVYVAVHELAHIMTTEIGHTPLFWSNFKKILSEAIEIGIYQKQDFANAPQEYCGIRITSSVV